MRLASDAQTSLIKDQFPPGIAQPALRALYAAGVQSLDELNRMTKSQLSSLHGMGPSAVRRLEAALTARGLRFLPEAGVEVDDYISQFPNEVQVILQKIRSLARKAAPNAVELISYRMPALRINGILIYYAAFKSHIGLFPPVSGDPSLETAIAPYAGPKGNLKFPFNKPIPYKLIERIVKLRVQQDRDRKRK